MSVIISGDNGISDVDGSAGTPAIRGTDANTGIFFPAADTIAFAEGGAEAMRIDSSGNVGIGQTNPSRLLVVGATNPVSNAGITSIQSAANLGNCYEWGHSNPAGFRSTLGAFAGGGQPFIGFSCEAGTNTNTFRTRGIAGSILSTNNAGALIFSRVTNANADNQTATDSMRITSGGELCVGQTVSGIANTGSSLLPSGRARFCISGSEVLEINRLVSDGILVLFYQDTVTEGNISVSGSTVSYNGGHLSRYAQTTTAKDESLKKGTVLSNLDEMNVYIAPTTYWTEEDELPEGVNVGDVKVETHEVQNEQLNKVKVSDVEGDANVAGVFVNWYYDEAHQVDEINMAMTGDMIIRIAQGVTVARGDLLMSAGDGTAMPQGDDIVRSKTIAKVTSTHVTCTYDDGSYCVPCVLMAC